MRPRRSFPGVIILLTLAASFSLALFTSHPARADVEDAAIFYEELKSLGNWYEDPDYGPAWYPTQDPNQPDKVYDATFRPYLDGRWNLTEQGFVFETTEPWGWAAYHYGNWALDKEGRWVWVPGRTWYPNTVNFKTSEEYVGWAPLPPPKVKKALAVSGAEEPGEAPVAPAPVAALPPPPPPAPAPMAPMPPPPVAPVGGYVPEPLPPMEPVGGYFPEPVYPTPTPVAGYPAPPPVPLIPAWTFVRAPMLLPGFGQPYAADFSYAQSDGALAPPEFLPVAYAQSEPVMNFASPDPYLPLDLLGVTAGAIGAASVGAYNWGPPPAYISSVTNISQTQINQTINDNSKNITKIKNVTPPDKVLKDNKGVKKVTPPNLVDGKPLPPNKPIKGDPATIKNAQANLGKPDGTKKVPNGKLPPGSLNKPPKGPAVPPDKAPGLGKPPVASKAEQKMTPQMQQQVKNLPAKTPTTPGGKPGVQSTPGAKPGHGGTPGATGTPTPPGVTPTTGKPSVTPGKTPTGPPGVKPSGAPGEKPWTPPTTGKPGTAPQPTTPGAKPGLVTPGAKPGAPPGAAPPAGKPPVTPGQPPAGPPSGFKPPITGPGFVSPGTQPSGAKPGAPSGQKPWAPPTTGKPGTPAQTTTPGAKPGLATPGTKPTTPAHPAAVEKPETGHSGAVNHQTGGDRSSGRLSRRRRHLRCISRRRRPRLPTQTHADAVHCS